MIDRLIRDLQALRKVDSLIGTIWLNVIARRLGLFAFAGLIAVFGLGMTNVAGFYALQTVAGPVWAAAVVAACDFAIAMIVFVVGKSAKPGRELEFALDVRKTALEAIREDASDLKGTVDGFRQDIRDTRESIVRFVHNPLDSAAQKLLIPAVLSIIRGLRSKKDQP